MRVAPAMATNVFASTPEPPEKLWIVEDPRFLDVVNVRADIRLTKIDPKNGCFEGRLKCYWTVRTLHNHQHTEPRIRVPGIRFSRIATVVEESRMWRDLASDTAETMFWRGTTAITFAGNELFEVQDFPFDKQIISLDQFEFVWRAAKQVYTHEESMRVVKFSMQTVSMLPEWETYPAMLTPLMVRENGGGPTTCSRFLARLRIQRRPRYYITQIFLVAYLIFASSILPLGLKPGDEHIGDRLALHGSGLLTLVSFRYSVANELPSVPYATFTSTFLTSQVVILVFVAAESLVVYKLTVVSQLAIIDADWINVLEDFMLLTLVAGWGLFLLYIYMFKHSRLWEEVLEAQQENNELEDETESEDDQVLSIRRKVYDRIVGSTSNHDLMTLSNRTEYRPRQRSALKN